MTVKNLVIIAIVIIGLLFPPWFNRKMSAQVKDWQKGFSIYPESNSDFRSQNFRWSVYELAKIGANYVTLIIPYYQQNLNSNQIERGWNTPSDESLIDGINYAKSLNLQVMLKFHIETHNNLWRAHVNPPNKLEWFSNYENIILHYSKIAADHNVDMLCLGAELINMSSATADPTNTARWLGLIEKVRQIYPNSLTYSANWGGNSWSNEKQQIQFWQALDYIGIAAYYRLGGNSEEEIKQHWEQWNQSDILPFYQRIGKPIIFTEVGYRSIVNSTKDPWNYIRQGREDQSEQARAYAALFSYWDQYDYIAGVHFWHWQTDPNKNDYTTHYTPQNKQAQKIIESWFKKDQSQNVSQNLINPPPQLSLSSNSNFNIQRNRVKVHLKLINEGGPLTKAMVDFEIFDSQNNKIFQRYYHSAIRSGENTLELEWYPDSNGTYTISLGIFSENWTVNYFWLDNILQFDFVKKEITDSFFAKHPNFTWLLNSPVVRAIIYAQILILP